MNVYKKSLKKIFAIVSIMLLLVVSINPMLSYAKPKKPVEVPNTSVSVYIRVEGYDHTIIPRTKVNVGVFDLNFYKGKARGSSATPSKGWPVTRFKKPTVAHALVKLLEQKGIKYDMQDYGWSLYFAMIDNEREFDILSTSGWMYRISGNMPPIGSQGYPLKGGEDIVWHFGAYGFNSTFTELQSNKKNVKKGGSIKFTLKGRKDNLETGETTQSLVPGGQIYINGKPYKAKGKILLTDAKGNIVVKFDKPGTYKVTAERFSKKKAIRDIVRPLPIIIKVTK